MVRGGGVHWVREIAWNPYLPREEKKKEKKTVFLAFVKGLLNPLQSLGEKNHAAMEMMW